MVGRSSVYRWVTAARDEGRRVAKPMGRGPKPIIRDETEVALCRLLEVDNPSVPMTMRHPPPASLDLGTGEQHRGYAQHRWPNRPEQCGWPERSPQTDDG